MKKFIFFVLSFCLLITNSVSFAASGERLNKVKLFYPEKTNNYFFEVPLNIHDDMSNVEEYTINELFKGSHLPQKCYTEIPDDQKINYVKVDGDTAYIDIDSSFLNKTNEISVYMFIEILRKNIFQFDNLQHFYVTFDGQKIETIDYFIFDQSFNRPAELHSSNKNIEKIKQYFKEKSNNEINDLLKSEALLQYSVRTSSSMPKTVWLDAGHGGPGTWYDASNLGGGSAIDIPNTGDRTYEKEINLAITLAARDKLEDFGYTVYMTRTTDQEVSLSTRYNNANSTNPTCFVSIHNNSAPNNPNASGVMALVPMENYCSAPYSDRLSQSYDLADWITHFLDMWHIPNWQGTNLIVDGNYCSLPKYVNAYNYLVECAFVGSNESDALYMINPNNQISVGEDIASAIMYWFYFNGWH